MARDWSNTRATRDAILQRMEAYGENIAAIPFCEYQERRELGVIWVVNIHIKVKRVTEFEIIGEGPTLAEALRKAYLGMNNEPALKKAAARANATFGVTV